MITYAILNGIYLFFKNVLSNVLPIADPEIIAKFDEVLGFFVERSVVLIKYYVPMPALIFAVKAIIATYVLSMATKLTMRLLNIISLGNVKSHEL